MKEIWIRCRQCGEMYKLSTGYSDTFCSYTCSNIYDKKVNDFLFYTTIVLTTAILALV